MALRCVVVGPRSTALPNEQMAWKGFGSPTLFSVPTTIAGAPGCYWAGQKSSVSTSLRRKWRFGAVAGVEGAGLVLSLRSHQIGCGVKYLVGGTSARESG